MATADELRQTITTNRQALSEAIDAAAGKWETGDDDNWSPRKVAEHCIPAEISFAGMVAGAMQGKAPEAGEANFASASDAATALVASAEASDKVLRYIEDRDLGKAAPMPDGIPFEKNIEGVLKLAAYHLNDHAGQIGNA